MSALVGILSFICFNGYATSNRILGPLEIPLKHLTGLDLSSWNSSLRHVPKFQPHAVQQVMLAENTPVLAGALPAFELFVDSWKTMVKDVDLIKENVVQFIKPGLTIAKKYHNRFSDTDAYIIAMYLLVINPSIRFAWIEKIWGSEDIKVAREIIITKMLEAN
ncbi:hypothetical protein C8R44DRAFT_740612 [Mycena epipterygia]|nr:hypothetical protein C8R44DRAFT_740612 [Mycena epipterygia]